MSHSSKNRHHGVSLLWSGAISDIFTEFFMWQELLKAGLGRGQDARWPGVGSGAMPMAEGRGAPRE